MSQGEDTPARRFADVIKAARLRARMTQNEVAAEANVGRYTVIRWEKGETQFPEPELIRRVAAVIGLDVREVVVALGYVTRDELGLPPEPARVVDPEYADVIDMLADPNVPARDKAEWAEYLRWQHNRSQPGRPQKGTPRGTQKAAPARSPSR
jgi:transcriptional regulator with XRE-family HTH domain